MKRRSKPALAPERDVNQVTPVGDQGFIMPLMLDKTVTFRVDPAILIRLYELGFGQRGYQVMHLVAQTMEDRMKANGKCLMSLIDFSASVKPLDPLGVLRHIHGRWDVRGRACARELHIRDVDVKKQLGVNHDMAYMNATSGTDISRNFITVFSPFNPEIVLMKVALVSKAVPGVQKMCATRRWEVWEVPRCENSAYHTVW